MHALYEEPGYREQGESEGKSFYEIIEASQTFGWRTFDYAALEAYKKNLVNEETAILYCSKRGIVSRGVDLIKKGRGENTTPLSDLQMIQSLEKKPTAPAVPVTETAPSLVMVPTIPLPAA